MGVIHDVVRHNARYNARHYAYFQVKLQFVHRDSVPSKKNRLIVHLKARQFIARAADLYRLQALLKLLQFGELDSRRLVQVQNVLRDKAMI